MFGGRLVEFCGRGGKVLGFEEQGVVVKCGYLVAAVVGGCGGAGRGCHGHGGWLPFEWR